MSILVGLALEVALALEVEFALEFENPPIRVIAPAPSSTLLYSEKKTSMKALQRTQINREVKRVPLWPKLTGDHPQRLNQISKITFHVQNGVEFIDPLTVTHLEASGNYTFIHQLNGRRVMISKTLKACSTVFPAYFLRTHQSFLVNPEQIQTYLRKEHIVRLDNGIILPVSRSGNGVIQKFVKNGR